MRFGFTHDAAFTQLILGPFWISYVPQTVPGQGRRFFFWCGRRRLWPWPPIDAKKMD